MKDKLLLFRILLIILMSCLLGWDILVGFTQVGHSLPHKQLLLTGALLWIFSFFLPQNSDDDNWVGGF